jgi:hypothetical protein
MRRKFIGDAAQNKGTAENAGKFRSKLGEAVQQFQKSPAFRCMVEP